MEVGLTVWNLTKRLLFFPLRKSQKGNLPICSFKYVRKKIACTQPTSQPDTRPLAGNSIWIGPWVAPWAAATSSCYCQSPRIFPVRTSDGSMADSLPVPSVRSFPSRWLCRGTVKSNYFVGTQKFKQLWNYWAQIIWHCTLEQLANLCDKAMLNVKQFHLIIW